MCSFNCFIVVDACLQASVGTADTSDEQMQESSGSHEILSQNICSVCEEVGGVAEMVLCSGAGCENHFHPSCSSSLSPTECSESLLCPDCRTGERICRLFVCQNLSQFFRWLQVSTRNVIG